ncbi:tripartite tricarboxylate transporter TctB family protein [Limnochorda pilosa]|uniref:DUF1468 domain-containing protein n=1 Tax=Limnochorda pilosa TaxID=1555112 RepID=A0A0K2SGN1_LIMPI|nr:tripartite tricarboxylate transporter TctB family protein [Limnochorda pilosa]BAS26245.1 hypothetical protein LIP_0388 [Limnochorda pilosa]
MKARLDAAGLVNLSIPVAFLGLGVYALVAASGLPEQPAQFPKVFAALLILLSLPSAVLAARRSGVRCAGASETTREGPRQRVRLVVLSLLYSISITQFGFYLSSLVWLPIMFISLGYRRYRTLLLVAAVTCAVLYAMFGMILAVPTPVGRILGF